MIDRFVYNPRLLAVFVFTAPLVAALGVGSLGDILMAPYVLIPVYLFGGIITSAAWAIYSFQFQLLDRQAEKLPLLRSNVALTIASLIFASIAGYGLVTLFFCSHGSWLFGGWINCALACAGRDWRLSLLPGAVCGALAAFLVIGELGNISSYDIGPPPRDRQ